MHTIAYIGFGVSVREYHIPYVENRSDAKIKYVYRREQDIPQFADYEPFYPEIIFTTDLDQILNDPEVDVVTVSAPDAFHIPYAKQILNAGKHCLVEKPFAPTAAEAREVFSLAKEKNLICMPHQNRRFDADFLALKEVIESGKIGEVKKQSEKIKEGGAIQAISAMLYDFRTSYKIKLGFSKSEVGVFKDSPYLKYSTAQLLQCINACTETVEKIKNGEIAEKDALMYVSLEITRILKK